MKSKLVGKRSFRHLNLYNSNITLDCRSKALEDIFNIKEGL